MNRLVSCLATGILLVATGATQAATYDDIFWVGGDGEWTGDVTADPEYSTGNWSTDPNAASGLPAKFVLGRNDGIRTGQVVGAGGYDADRLPCDSAAQCTTVPAVTISGGTQLGTDIYINNGATVFYNPNNQLTSGDDAPDRFGDFRFQAFAGTPGTPTLNLSNGSKFTHNTGSGGDPDGMWTRWNGAELNLDGEGTVFRRTASNGRAGGAWMFASFHGFDNSVQTVSLTNGARFENRGQAWFGQSSTDLMDGNAAGIRVVMTINGGHMDLTGGDEYGLDNDGLMLRSDLAFVYDHTPDGDMNPADDELYVINFTGPGTITVDGVNASPLDTTAFPLPPGTARGGIRVARQTGNLIDVNPDPQVEELVAEYVGRDTQVSYQDLWNLGILRANGLSGPAELGGANFNDYFTTTNNPGDNDYKLTSTLSAPAPVLPGDYNRDGKVGAEDWVVLKKGSLLADGNGSLHIDPVDEMIWRKNFGLGGPGGSATPAPEPAALLLMLIGLASVSLIRKRAS